MRQLKREVKIGNVTIGGKNPIAVQTMLNVPVEDIEGNVAQAKRCEAAGCQILRVTCPSAADAKCIQLSYKKTYHHGNKIWKKVSIPGNKIQEFVILSLLLIFI